MEKPSVVIDCKICHRTVWNYDDYGYGSGPCAHSNKTLSPHEVIGGPMVDPPAKVIGHYRPKNRDRRH